MRRFLRVAILTVYLRTRLPAHRSFRPLSVSLAIAYLALISLSLSLVLYLYL